MNTGQVCAQIAVDTVLDRFEPYEVLNQPDYFFRTAFYEANQRIQATLGERRGGASLGAVFYKPYTFSLCDCRECTDCVVSRRELIPLSKGQTLGHFWLWKRGRRKDHPSGGALEHGGETAVELSRDGWIS